MRRICMSLPLLFIVNLGCQQKESKVQPEKVRTSTGESWSGQMTDLKESLANLFPLIVDPAKFSAASNKAVIETEVKNLKNLSQRISHNQFVTVQDPSVRFLSRAFVEDLARIDESVQVGRMEYARYELMNVTSYCIECHTRTSTGPSFSGEHFTNALKNLRPLQRGEYLASTRQFDQALKEFDSILKAPPKEGISFDDWDRAARYALAIAVKYNKDPNKALEVSQTILNSGLAPYYLKQDAKVWSEAILEWKNEKKSKASANNVKAQLASVQALLSKGMMKQAGISDHAGDIYYLRALSEVHGMMLQSLDKQDLGQALYLTGSAYESVRSLSMWNLHENYYEACIRSASHTPWSEKCYKNYEESVYIGYSGSSGVNIPVDVQVRLSELKKLAFPELQKSKQ